MNLEDDGPEPESFWHRVGRAIKRKPKRKSRRGDIVHIRKPKGPFWTTKEGVKISIKDMDTPHIKNVIRFLKRRKAALDFEYLTFPEPQGEQAALALNSEMEHFLDAEPEEVFPILHDLEAELEKRRDEFFDLIEKS